MLFCKCLCLILLCKTCRGFPARYHSVVHAAILWTFKCPEIGLFTLTSQKYKPKSVRWESVIVCFWFFFFFLWICTPHVILHCTNYTGCSYLMRLTTSQSISAFSKLYSHVLPVVKGIQTMNKVILCQRYVLCSFLVRFLKPNTPNSCEGNVQILWTAR